MNRRQILLQLVKNAHQLLNLLWRLLLELLLLLWSILALGVLRRPELVLLCINVRRLNYRSGWHVLLLGLLRTIVKLMLLGSSVHLRSQVSLLLHQIDSLMQIHTRLRFIGYHFCLRLKAI